MAMQLVAGVQSRLKAAVREFVDDQRNERKKNDQESLIGRAVVRLGTGWSPSSLKTAMGLKARKNPDQLPQSSALVRFCAVADVSTEWLFANVGPPKRSSLRAGGTLATKDLAREFAAHILAACKGAYGSGIDLRCDPERLLEMITSAVRDDVDADSKTFDRRARLLSAVNRAEAALGNDLNDSQSRSAAQDQIMETLYHLNRVVWETGEPVLRIPIWPATP